MRLFWELVKRSFRRHLTYRAAALAGLLTNFFFGLLRASVLVALYGEQQVVAGITLQGVVTYAGLTQAVIAYLSIFNWWGLMDSVYTGEIAVDLLKPISLFRFWLAQDIGRAAVSFFLRGLTLVGLYALIFDLTVPQTTGQWLALGAALVLSLLVSFAWRFLVNLAAFWTPNARGIGRFAFVLSWFASGFLMPIRFYPDWLQRLCQLTPFPHMLNSVVEIYLGTLSGPAMLQALGLQLVWFVALALLAQLVLRAGVRRLVILGG